ncbi:MAG: heat-inducible transcriptional repressor HrcA [Acidiferrobacteraceae bacterium]|jgi:heat-inducible transcriptional repressor|nr:heat-inducible transcriptional repressor HrcA [Acidiferrobacteraceae bacterium]MDP6124017.1 heat-inducible transcriptional repressor HrcA [Arenicellales bacterium]MDP6434369.1 heat-inducible transcriptional repressor HrcA [Arenicellales bacterium]MDP6672667.1 heat-inducible transcriptional repressor HrcA [Arenicellales bacterium]MDP6725333.1 heat-inducible transcriptional repressor HrcA [Arenicellales bacterium]|tara:strand:- start:1108 stop:2166 length:1059 start_codon:yes stop_codon:yes gene_type:complete
MSNNLLNQRTEFLFRALIQRYINDGNPVGSRVLARESGLEVSPATVRNIMADLEDMGLISSPHTSAGRMPTQKGYRFFIDSMLTVKKLRPEVIDEIEDEFSGDTDPTALVAKASSLLSRISHFAGVVVAPNADQARFRQLEFVSLSDQRVLVILVTTDGRVQNRVIHVDRDYSPSELVEAANYFNEMNSGNTLGVVRMQIINEMKSESDEMSRIMRVAMSMAREFFDEEQDHESDVVLSGEENLFDIPDFNEMKKLREIFDAFRAKSDLLTLLDQSMQAQGVHIFIGDESGYKALHDCSLVTASYQVEGERIGTLGVIGPTRMAYESVIPFVDVTARLLSSALSGNTNPRLT